MMKRILTYLFAGLFLLPSCGEIPENNDGLLALTSDRDVVEVCSQVTFSVKYASVQDVTSMSKIRCVQTSRYIDGNTFVSEQSGEWSFVAEYDGLESEEVVITVTDPVQSHFRKHVSVIEFTGQWCAQCPSGATTINYFATQEYPGLVHILAFHNANGGDQDEFELPQEAELYKMFNPGGYPGYAIDMKSSGTVTGGNFSTDLSAAIKAKTYCGVALSGKVEGEKASVVARVVSDVASEYRIAAYVIEDKIVAKQNVNGTYKDDYVHRHVVRKMLSASVLGDALGRLTPGNEASKEYSFALDPSWKKENLSVCVMVLGTDGYVANTNECALDGGVSNYDEIN